MPHAPWTLLPPTPEHFTHPPREYGIYPFWFLNGNLDPAQMRFQLGEFRNKEMPGIILHGRFGLELEYLGDEYRDRIRLAVERGMELGLTTWIYDEMNWPSGTADGRVVRERPDLSQRYIECINFAIRGPWFACLTGGDSRYLDFERSVPLAAFAMEQGGEVVDLTPNLSFENVIPWEVPPGNWRIMYIVEKRAEYYIDALNPKSTAEFLRLGYDPYMDALDGVDCAKAMVGFYTDEPAMHYYVTGGNNPIVPWTRDMFRRFAERNGYNLRPHLPDLFFDVSDQSARVRQDFYATLTAFYSDAYYRQIRDWCREHDVLFTGHLLYEEGLRQMVRVEGNPFSHYRHLDVIGVDHLYPIIGNRDRPSEHVAMKLASSAAHHFGSNRLLCESFGGIFMDATMQRMKWLTDWEYVLGVNLLNPHGFHYTLEGPRKRDWPPSMFYQYPWWHFYGEFSSYVSRLSHMLSGGRHVARVAILWPINDIFASYTPQSTNAMATRTETDFNVLTDLLLRLHFDYDYLDEDILTGADIGNGHIIIRDEAFDLVILPPMSHLKLATLEALERFVAGGGKVLGTIFLPDRAFTDDGPIDISDRIQALFGADPASTQRQHTSQLTIDVTIRTHDGGGQASFLRSYALNRYLPNQLQRELKTPGVPESDTILVEEIDGTTRYSFTGPDGTTQDITNEIWLEREEVGEALRSAILDLIDPDVVISNAEIFSLHRVKDDRDLYFIVNPTFTPQAATVSLTGEVRPVRWNPSTGTQQPIAPWEIKAGRTSFAVDLPPTGSVFIMTENPGTVRIAASDAAVDLISDTRIEGHFAGARATIELEIDGNMSRHTVTTDSAVEPITLDSVWTFRAEDANALLVRTMQASARPTDQATVLAGSDNVKWLTMVPGAWSYQLPGEPEDEYPFEVWYRMSFEAAFVPETIDLIVDGFAGDSHRIFVNGKAPTSAPSVSNIDSQMMAVDISDLVAEGHNELVVGITVTKATDGLLDIVKITGDFALEQQEVDYCIVPSIDACNPAAWTGQGYPWYSGRGVYTTTFTLLDDLLGKRIVLQPEMIDDVLEVVINGVSAGVRLWAPYEIDLTEYLRPGENRLELRVANTLINLLEAVPRPSGLAGPPTLVPWNRFDLDLKAGTSHAD